MPLYKISDMASKILAQCAKDYGMNKSEALEWLIRETASPTVPKRGKVSRTESIELFLSAEETKIVEALAHTYDCTPSAVIEAYLQRAAG
jgi:hypothetical protein